MISHQIRTQIWVTTFIFHSSVTHDLCFNLMREYARQKETRSYDPIHFESVFTDGVARNDGVIMIGISFTCVAFSPQIW